MGDSEAGVGRGCALIEILAQVQVQAVAVCLDIYHVPSYTWPQSRYW